MSVDTVAIIDRSNSFFDDLSRACVIMAEQCPMLTQLRDHAHQRIIEPAAHPHFDINKNTTGNVELHCRNLVVDVRPHIVVLYHGVRHPFGLNGPPYGDLFRRVTGEIAALCGSTRAVYVPEICWDGDTVESVIDDMARAYGPPANSVADLENRAEAATDYWHPGCFFIDDFRDL